ncbi:MAG TPA: hypothetical protein VGJ90_01510 [Methylophilaceae bacterium]|jgi:hypothetical protein
MNKIKLLYCVMGFAGIAFSSSASAHGYGHGGFHGGFHSSFGLYLSAPYPYYASPYYTSPYYYPYAYPPTVVVPAPAQPPVYIQQDSQPQIQPQVQQQSPAPQANNYWYHCDNPDGYYPYVKECLAGWKQVSPTPSSPQ